jgi:hypothetical protein
LCVVHLFEVARRIGTTLSSPPTTAPKPPGAVPGATKRAVPGARESPCVAWPIANRLEVCLCGNVRYRVSISLMMLATVPLKVTSKLNVFFIKRSNLSRLAGVQGKHR